MEMDDSSRFRQVITGLPGYPEQTAMEIEAIFRAFPDMMFTLDTSGVILHYRAGEPSLLFTSPQAFLGRKVDEVMPPEVGRLFMQAITRMTATSFIESIRYSLALPQGERWFEARLVHFPPDRIVAIIRDITDPVQATERVRQQLRQISALHAIDVAITSSFDLNVTLSVILREVLNQLGVDAADVLLFNQVTRMLEFAGGQGFRTPGFQRTAVRIGQGFAGTAALERRTISSMDLNARSLGVPASRELAGEGFVSYYAVPLLAKGQVKGILEIYHRSRLDSSETWLEFLAALASRAALAIDSAELFQNLQQTNTELNLAYDSAIAGWSQALEISGRENPEHTRRVLELTMRLAQQLGVNEQELPHIHRGVLLHDIGNLGIPEIILLKTEGLSETERAVVREHPRLAAQMLKSVPYLLPALDIPCSHHERWNGSGYPDGLLGEKIPLAARLFAVVDVYDSMTSSRPYRPALSEQQALEYLAVNSGVLFDPNIVSPFIEMVTHNNPAIDRGKIIISQPERPSGRQAP